MFRFELVFHLVTDNSKLRRGICTVYRILRWAQLQSLDGGFSAILTVLVNDFSKRITESGVCKGSLEAEPVRFVAFGWLL